DREEGGRGRLFIAGVGDIHGRFHRVQGWLRELEEARRRPLDLVLSVGDVEAFPTADDHRRKAAKRAMPAEFADYASGAARLHRPLFFIGGNNEDFAALHPIPEGGTVATDLHYLGRAGARRFDGIHVAWLSGIYAPKHVDTPLAPPTTPGTQKQAGYFRTPEVERLRSLRQVDLLLVHEWPRGLFQRVAGRPVRPWMGNLVTRSMVDAVKPAWLWCGHSHETLAATLRHPDGTETSVVCLDEAAEPEGAVFWMEWDKGSAREAGWGTSGTRVWRAGEPWGPARRPRSAR
ncbi:MAG TPA: metallophosphoesterase, partial [Myxococcaceae bacterium]|nr:metallophosphoesterase [Myxococcaceae bacterium]